MRPAPVDAYLAKAPWPHRKTLGTLRKTIRGLLPNAEETLSWGMPCFQVDGKGVAAFAAFREHCAYFPMSGTVVSSLEKELSRFRVSRGGVQFAPGTGLSAGLVKKLVRLRLEELSTPPAKGTGSARTYHDNGVIQSRGQYAAGKMHGRWEFFRRDGSLMRTGEFTRGAQSGVWRTWDARGRMVNETRF
jgi:uncharacterized protein YdhG (YjbR/CyaY superfamily)